jgi:hypothetical protein
MTGKRSAELPTIWGSSAAIKSAVPSGRSRQALFAQRQERHNDHKEEKYAPTRLEDIAPDVRAPFEPEARAKAFATAVTGGASCRSCPAGQKDARLGGSHRRRAARDARTGIG